MSKPKKIIDPQIKKSIEDDVNRIIDIVKQKEPSYNEKPSCIWYDSINVCRMELFSRAPRELLQKLRDNPYVISASVKTDKQTNTSGTEYHVVQFHIYPTPNCITKIKMKTYHMKRQNMVLYLTLKVIVLLSLLSFLLWLFLNFVVYPFENE